MGAWVNVQCLLGGGGAGRSVLLDWNGITLCPLNDPWREFYENNLSQLPEERTKLQGPEEIVGHMEQHSPICLWIDSVSDSVDADADADDYDDVWWSGSGSEEEWLWSFNENSRNSNPIWIDSLLYSPPTPPTPSPLREEVASTLSILVLRLVIALVLSNTQ